MKSLLMLFFIVTSHYQITQTLIMLLFNNNPLAQKKYNNLVKIGGQIWGYCTPLEQIKELAKKEVEQWLLNNKQTFITHYVNNKTWIYAKEDKR
jgi:hypothetical protein